MIKSIWARWAAVGLLGLSLPVLAVTTGPAKAKLVSMHGAAVHPTATKGNASIKPVAKTTAKPQIHTQHKKLTTTSKKVAPASHKPLVKSKTSVRTTSRPTAKKPLATKATARKTVAKKTTVRKAPPQKFSTKPANRKSTTLSKNAR
jgi:hypothetical protein